MKYEFMLQNEKETDIKMMSKVFNVSRSGYYQFKRASKSSRAIENESLVQKIKVLHETYRATYGSPRIYKALRAEGVFCSRVRVAKLMKQAGIQAKMKKRFKRTTRADLRNKVAPNLLQQNFTATMPNQRWVADFTYVLTLEGWLYVAVVLDLFSRRVVGLSMQERMTTDLVTTALMQAVIHRKPSGGLVHHSDRGCQYTSDEFQTLLQQHNITASMSSTGNCYDNAVAESFFHTLKTELVYFERYETREQAKRSIFEYIEVFYNRKRLHSTTNYLAPVEFEKQWNDQAKFYLARVH
jgi:transposase InsO family protein